MKVNYKDNMNIIFRWMPNGVMHLAIILLIPIYLIVGIFKGGLIEVMKDWWSEFNSKWVFSEGYNKKRSNQWNK